MEFTPRQKGFNVYEVSVTPQSEEWLATNNRRQFGLEVTDPTIRVLYMEGTPQNKNSPQPEWKYLKDALESDKYIKVTTLYRQLGNNGQFLNTVDADPETGQKIYPVEHPTKGFPRTLAGLLEYDVVIHSDIRISSFSPQQLESISKLVEQHGGGFVMIGGNSAFGKGGYHQTILDRIIPVAMSSANDSEARPVKLQLTRQGLTHPIVNFAGNAEVTKRIWWDKFPTLFGMNQVERAKPGATVLAQEGDVSGAAFQEGRTCSSRCRSSAAGAPWRSPATPPVRGGATSRRSGANPSGRAGRRARRIRIRGITGSSGSTPFAGWPPARRAGPTSRL